MGIIRRVLIAVLVVGVIGALVFAVVRLTADEASSEDDQVIVIDEVDRMTLQDVIVLRGQVAREEVRVVTAAAGGRISALGVAEDEVVTAGDELLRLNGRPMLAIDDPEPYWRPLTVGVPDGPDVERLERFLTDEGYEPGTVNQEFSTATRDALEVWQEDNGYPIDGTFLPTDVVTGSWPATVGSVLPAVGDTVAIGQPLVGFVEPELSVAVQIDPTDRSRLSIGLVTVVEVPATGATGTGEIADLAEAATVDAQGVERYRGEIDLDTDLGVVDGTAVRIEVIVRQVIDALVVPVAAVSLNGDGREEVRILNAEGTIDRVLVETGLTEGALVEITSGLDGSELVVVEVREQ